MKQKEAVIITGASSGIGKDGAEHLAAQGFQVFACVRKDPEKVKAKGIAPLILDVTDKASITKAVQEAAPQLNKAAKVHLVNNAGIAVGGPVETVSLERWREQFEVNVFGLVAVTQAFLPFIRRTQGRIVNISSVSGLATSPYLGPYSASKFAVEAITDALRRELKQFGIKVIALEPGPVATPIWNKGLSNKDSLTGAMTKEQAALYERELAAFRKAVEASARSAVPVREVSLAVHKALATPNPKARTIVGTRATKMQASLLPFFPTQWVDSLIAKEFR